MHLTCILHVGLYSLYPPCLGRVACAVFEAGKNAECIIDGEEKLVEVYKDFFELENSNY